VDHEGEQEKAFLRLGELVGSLATDCLVFHYGTYEATALRKAIARIPPAKRDAVQAVVAKMVNVLSFVHRHVYFPTCSNTLKDVGKALGCQWTSPEASGVQSIVWRERWERTHDPAIKDKLLAYNREDCLALERVCGFVADVGMPRPKSGMEDASGPKIVATSDLPRPPSKWRATEGRAS
jgi:predicted RecB family nuclease